MIKFNIVFYFLVIVAIIFLWFALAFLFKPIGKFFIRLYEDAKKEMETEKEEKED